MFISLFEWLAAQKGLAGAASAAADQELLLADFKAQANPSARQTYLIFLKESTTPHLVGGKAQLLLQQVAPGTKPRQIFDQLGGFSVDLNETQAGRLRQRREVESMGLDQPIRLDPPIRPNRAENVVFLPQVLASYGNATSSSGEVVPWGVRAIWQGRDISTTGNSGAGTYAFVIDSGVLATTGDLNLNTSWSRSWINGQDAFSDGAGHGTHVAGTIGALVNGSGVVGVAPGASIVSLKVFDNNGSGSSSTIVDAINYAVSIIKNNSLDLAKVVINLSLGGGLNAALNSAMINAANQGIRFAVAAGNSGVDADTASPATTGTHPNIYTVSAVDSAYKMPSWSNWDQVTANDPLDSVDFAAPGVNVLSYYQNGSLAQLSGTSMASPHVAGALLMGGVTAGDLVTPSLAGTADPFAWASKFPGSSPSPATPTIANMVLWGTTNNDTIVGGSGNDIITGVLKTGETGAALGAGQIDILTGGAGADTFLLGDSRGVFYDDGKNGSIGSADYARITDFQTGADKLQLRNGSYFTSLSNGITSLYWDRNANNRFDSSGSNQDELIAMVSGSFASTDINWV